MADPVTNQKRNLPLLATRDLCSGKTYIVTGANSGLGFEAAKHLVSLGAAKVILAVRTLSTGESAKAEIEATTGSAGVAEVWPLDLSSYDSVKAFAARACSELDRIDGLIENAAVALAQRAMAEGHIAPVTVNVLSTFLLATLLLPKMSGSAKAFGTVPHLVIVTSRAAFDVEADWLRIKDDPLTKMDEEGMEMMKTCVAKHQIKSNLYGTIALADMPKSCSDTPSPN